MACLLASVGISIPEIDRLRYRLGECQGLLAIFSYVEPSEQPCCKQQARHCSERVGKFPASIPISIPKSYDPAHALGTGSRMIDPCVAQGNCPRAFGQAAQKFLVGAWTDRLSLTGRNSLLMQPLYPRLKFVLASRGPESKPIHRGGSPG